MTREDDEREEKRGFKVADRRRFSETGEPRADTAAPETAAPAAAPPVAEPMPPPADHPAAPAAGSTPPRGAGRESSPLELSFSTFVISLSTQALAHLGEIPDPIEHRTVVELGAAKQMIDILGILKDKTKGNLDRSEAALLDNMLYDLRLKYVERARRRS
jgi:hypothetical protein